MDIVGNMKARNITVPLGSSSDPTVVESLFCTIIVIEDHIFPAWLS